MSKTPAHAASVSRMLAKAGFDRFEAETTSVRGHYRYSPGFKVASHHQGKPYGKTVVQHEMLNSYGEKDPRPWREVEAEMLDRYEQVLQSRYRVERKESDWHTHLVVWHVD